MKSLFRLPNLLILAVAIFAFSACNSDPQFSIPPTVNLLDEAGFLANDATLADGSPIIVRIKAEKGDNPMKSLEFQQDGVRIGDFSRIEVDGAAASSAALLLIDGDADAFTKDISITPHATGTADYTFVVADDAGESSSVTLTITIESEPPTLSATNGLLNLTGTAGVLATLALDAAKSPSGAELATLSVYEDGSLATGANRFFFNDVEFEGSIDLVDGDRDGLNGNKLLIRASDTPGTTESFVVEVTDANGLTAQLNVTLKADDAVVTTPLEKTINGTLLNSAGMAGTGGLDLDTGVGSGSSELTSEIKDEGIDLSLPNASNWKQQISTIDGAILKYINPSTLPDAFDFSAVDNKEAIQGLYDANTAIIISNVVNQGDIFAVSDNGKIYLLEVASINNTTGDNLDSYTFNIKF